MTKALKPYTALVGELRALGLLTEGNELNIAMPPTVAARNEPDPMNAHQWLCSALGRDQTFVSGRSAADRACD